MDRIIWDDQMMETIMERLRKAADALDQCGLEIRSGYYAGLELFQKNTGNSRKILSSMVSAMHRAELLSERTAVLNAAVGKARSMISEAEASISGVTEDLSDDSTSTIQAFRGRRDFPQNSLVLYYHMPERFTGIVPQWLHDAADSAQLP